MRSISGRMALLAMILGIAGLLGWITHTPLLIYVLDGYPAMSPNTAISIMLSSVALIFVARHHQHNQNGRKLWPANVMMLVVVLLNLSSIADWALDGELLPPHYMAELLSGSPGTVISSPYTAFVLLLNALSLVFYVNCQQEHCIHRIQYLLFLSLGVLLIVFSGYMYSVQSFYRVDYAVGMALHTFIGLVLLTLGALFLRPDAGVLGLLKGPFIGSRLIRRSIIPVVLALAVFYAFGTLAGQDSAEYSAIGFLLILLSSLYFLSTLALRVNYEEQLKDRALNEFDDFFDSSEDGLILVEEDGKIIRVNSFVEKLTQYRPKELIGQFAETLIPEHQRENHVQLRSAAVRQKHSRVIADGFRGMIARKDGNEYPVLIGLKMVRLYNRELVLVTLRDIHEQLDIEKELFRLGYAASHDALTGLPNRNVIFDMARREFSAASRRSHKVAVCFCDLDDFKKINDTHGHRMGDRVLTEVARRLEHALRQQDLICRVGGDEFVILITDIECIEDAESVVEKIIEKVREPYQISDMELSIGMSVGMSFYPDDGESIDELIEMADKRLYQAKQSKTS